MRVDLRQKFGVAFLGLAAGLLLLEAALRFIGYAHLKQAGSAQFQSDNTYKILCIGDSYTFGIGASRGREYPAQLQEILDSRCKPGNFTVINKGVSSWNTAMTLRWFRDYLLRERKPDLVILLSGGANGWNAIGRSTNPGWMEILLDAKVYKLYRLSVSGIKDRIGEGHKSGRSKFPGLGIPPELQALRGNINRALQSKDPAAALAYAEKMIELNPKLQKGYIAAANILEFQFNRWGRASIYYKKAIEVDPANLKSVDCYNDYTRCIGNNIRSRQPEPEADSMQEAVRFIGAGMKYFPHLNYNIKMLQDLDAYFYGTLSWIEADLGRIRSLCLESGIKLMIMNYPRSDSYFSKANAAIESFAGKYDIPLVNNCSAFQGLLEQGSEFKDLFAPDQHCNDNGYRVIAENVYDRMVSSGLLGARK